MAVTRYPEELRLRLPRGMPEALSLEAGYTPLHHPYGMGTPGAAAQPAGGGRIAPRWDRCHQ